MFFIRSGWRIVSFEYILVFHIQCFGTSLRSSWTGTNTSDTWCWSTSSPTPAVAGRGCDQPSMSGRWKSTCTWFWRIRLTLREFHHGFLSRLNQSRFPSFVSFSVNITKIGRSCSIRKGAACCRWCPPGSGRFCSRSALMKVTSTHLREADAHLSVHRPPSWLRPLPNRCPSYRRRVPIKVGFNFYRRLLILTFIVVHLQAVRRMKSGRRSVGRIKSFRSTKTVSRHRTKPTPGAFDFRWVPDGPWNLKIGLRGFWSICSRIAFTCAKVNFAEFLRILLCQYLGNFPRI